MKSKHLLLVLLLGLFSPILSTQAAKVANLAVSGNTDHLNLLWDKLSSTDYNDADGYAMQWSDRQTDVKITNSITQYRTNNSDDIALRRGSFENDLYYFVRVYTYKIDENNRKVLGHGSDMLKFKISFQNEVTSESIVVTDSVISTATGTAQDTSDFEFGALRKYPYDTFVDFFWSRSRDMLSSDFDGFMIRLSKKSDMTDPLLETTTATDHTELRITGFEPSTAYYAQGYFFKNQGGEKKTFGDSAIKSFKTIAAIVRDNSTRASRNIVKVERKAIRKVAIDGSTTDETTTSTSTTSSTSSSSTTVTTSSQSEINGASQTEIKNKVADLKKQIKALQAEQRRWEAKLTTRSTTSTSTKSTSSTSSGLSIRERLKLILEAKRNK